MHYFASTSVPRRQRGATLVIALLILVLIMMIGITAVSTSDTQFKLAGNLQFEDSALNNAEAAVTDAERWLSRVPGAFNNAAFTAIDPTTSPDPGSNAATPELLPRTTVDSVRTSRITQPFSMTWSTANSRCAGDGDLATAACEVPGDPAQLYFIELMSLNNRLAGSSQIVGGRASSGCNTVNTYLITGRGVSARGATKFVQSYYSVLNCPT
jgi:Tfp pilus assembly protein PilX